MKGKGRDGSSLVDPKRIVKLRNSSERPQLFSEIFRNSCMIFGNSDTAKLGKQSQTFDSEKVGRYVSGHPWDQTQLSLTGGVRLRKVEK